MRILQVNCVYKVGSTGKIVDCVGEVLRGMGHDVLTCYGIGNNHYDDFSIKICSSIEHKINALMMRIRGVPYGGVYCSNRRLYKIIDAFQPDVVHIHCINASMINVYHLFKYLGKNKIKTVITLHAEIYHTAGCEHAFDCEKYKTYCHNCKSYCFESWFFKRAKISWQKMYDAINSFEQGCLAITAVSPWLKGRAEQSSILRKYKVEYIPNGIDTSIFHAYNDTFIVDRDAYRGMVLFVTSIFTLKETDQKGGHFILDLARLMPKTKFVVVASRSEVLLEKLPDNVQFLGHAQSQNELAKLYSEADVTLILSRRESFSMVTAESLCCGTPVVGFKSGGPESIAINGYSSFVEYKDLAALSDAIHRQIEKHSNKSIIAASASIRFSKENMALAYLKRYETFKNQTC